jgi:ubiquinone/menaquinone biosynthesis C-methylase UbiE
MKKSVYEQTTEVYNKLGKKYLDDSKKIIPIERLPFSKLFKKDNNILDLGCGGGRDAKFFTSKGLKVTGIDSSSVLIKLARKEAPMATFQCVDLLKMNFSKETFDGIWAEAVLLHLKRRDIPRALKKLHNILKQNGLFYVRVKQGKGEAHVKEKLSGWQERFYTYFSKKEIETLIKKEGFKIVYSKFLPDEHKRPDVSWVAVLARK